MEVEIEEGEERSNEINYGFIWRFEIRKKENTVNVGMK